MRKFWRIDEGVSHRNKIKDEGSREKKYMAMIYLKASSSRKLKGEFYNG